MKKGLVILMALTMVLALGGIAMAKGDISPSTYDISGKTWTYYEQGNAVNSGGYTGSTGFGTSTHPRGTWNSPYTAGIDGYNYNDAQDYTDTGTQLGGKFTSGPHGGYATTTHRCRECHAVHRAAGKFKLLRSDTRFEACDWCHGTGAGSGFNIEMDNDDGYTKEYNVGHSMGFGVSEGKWKAPDDTYPAFTPNYWLGGFSCFDCHSPHANPQRLLGYNDAGIAVGLTGVVDGDTKWYGIANPGHGLLAGDTTHVTNQPVYLSGSWLLIKDPDRETVVNAESTVNFWNVNKAGGAGPDTTATVMGQEISDTIFAYSQIIGGEATVTAGQLRQYSLTTAYPVNKVPTDWNEPLGGVSATDATLGSTQRNTSKPYWNVSEFCTDCHDGNAGLHTVRAPLFSEDRALRATPSINTTEQGGSYDLAYGHDEQSRHGCDRQMKFNPEDGQDYGPSCRNCHKGSSGCKTCHDSSGSAYTTDLALAADNGQNVTAYDVLKTSTGSDNINAGATTTFGFFKQSRTVAWSNGWRQSTAAVTDAQIDAICSDDGFSWPHRTLGWKMLKDDLFGLNFDGTPVRVGDGTSAGTFRTVGTTNYPVHDLDSVCLDCHNPTSWRATITYGENSHVDNGGNTVYNDELILRGLP